MVNSKGGNLPDDVLIEILSRLPVKSLLRLMCVSKDWFRLISSPSTPGSVKYFHDQWSLNNSPLATFWCDHKGYIDGSASVPLHILVLDLLSKEVLSDFSLGNCKEGVFHVNGCGGLVCFADWRGMRINICNPSTQEVVTLPKSKSSKYPVTIGLGYIPSTNQYKVVRWFYLSQCKVMYSYTVWRHLISDIDYINDAEEMGCEIFTLTDGVNPRLSSWRATSNFRKYDLAPEPVCVNGVIYWQIKRSYSILAFDLEKEVTRIFFAPPVRKGCYLKEETTRYLTPTLGKERYLVELGGLLCIVEESGDLTSVLALEDLNKQKWISRIYKDDRPFMYPPIPFSNPKERALYLAKCPSHDWHYKTEGDGFQSLKECGFNRRCVCFESFFSLGKKRQVKLKEMDGRKRRGPDEKVIKERKEGKRRRLVQV